MILALDLATTTGVAFGPPCEPPRAWSFTVRGKHPEKFTVFTQAIATLMRSHKPKHVVIEAPFVSKPDVARVLMGMRGVVMGAAGLYGVTAEERQISAIRKHFIGDSGGKREEAKRRVMQRCRDLGWPVQSDDEADAIALWSMVASEISEEHSRWTMGLGDVR